jgi:hypothetical protein
MLHSDSPSFDKTVASPNPLLQLMISVIGVDILCYIRILLLALTKLSRPTFSCIARPFFFEHNNSVVYTL